MKFLLFTAFFLLQTHRSDANSAILPLLQLLQPLDLLPQINLNATNNQECKDDLMHWKAMLEAFVTGMRIQCGDDMECLQSQKNISDSSIFAAKQVDAFGRIPSSLLNMNNLWQGSWEECMAIQSPSRPRYKTKFCWQKIATPITLQVINQTTRCAVKVNLNKCWPLGVRVCRSPAQTIAILVIAAFLIVVSSLLDYFTDCPEGKYKKFRNGVGIRCLLAFSMYTNGSELLSTARLPGQINSLHCIRVFSMTWVMLGHTLLQYMYGDDLQELMNSNHYFLNLAFTNAFFSVDSFLFIGGLLLTYLFMKDIDRRPANLKSGGYWFLYYLHRILRLSPPYYIFLGFTVAMFDFLTIGPTKMNDIATVTGCHKSWWRNVLYVNNLWDLENMCMGHAWYLALDMQIHIFAPLFLIPLALHYIGGIVSGVILIAISTGLNYWAYYKWDLPATFMGYFTHASLIDLSETAKFQQFVYFCSWVRYTPYIIGGWTGYFLFKMKKHNIKLRLHWLIVIGFWICAAATAIACVYGLFDYNKGGEISLIGRASYYNWSRIAWSIALAWIVIACEHNLAGPAKIFLEQGFWAPFSRLTYCAYLTHFVLISILFAMSRQPLHYTNNTNLYINGAVPVFVLSYAVSFVWSCAFEIPSTKLEKMATAAIFGGGVTRHQNPVTGAPEKPFFEEKRKKATDAWATSEDGEVNGTIVPTIDGKLWVGETRHRNVASIQPADVLPSYVQGSNSYRILGMQKSDYEKPLPHVSSGNDAGYEKL